MGRKFRIYSEVLEKDGSQFRLVFEVNGKVEKEKTDLYCFDDVLICSYEFFSKNLEEYKFDGRRDTYEVNLNYIW